MTAGIKMENHSPYTTGRKKSLEIQILFILTVLVKFRCCLGREGERFYKIIVYLSLHKLTLACSHNFMFRTITAAVAFRQVMEQLCLLEGSHIWNKFTQHL